MRIACLAVAALALILAAFLSRRKDGVLIPAFGFYLGITNRAYSNIINGLFIETDTNTITFRTGFNHETVIYLPCSRIKGRKGKWNWNSDHLARRYGYKVEENFGTSWHFRSEWFGNHLAL